MKKCCEAFPPWRGFPKIHGVSLANLFIMIIKNSNIKPIPSTSYTMGEWTGNRVPSISSDYLNKIVSESTANIGHTRIDVLNCPNLQLPEGGFKLKPQEATRYDSGKANWSLMPFEAVEEILKVLEFGALKYDGWNFAKGAGMKWTRVSNSLLRHVFAWVRGEDNDPESGLSHLGHIGCNVIFLIYYMKHGTVYGAGDDRFKR